MNYVLPRNDCCPLNFMLAILSGMKIGFKIIPDTQGLQFKQHLEGVRLPGQRRHKNRESNKPREINKELIEKINKLLS